MKNNLSVVHAGLVPSQVLSASFGNNNHHNKSGKKKKAQPLQVLHLVSTEKSVNDLLMMIPSQIRVSSEERHRQPDKKSKRKQLRTNTGWITSTQQAWTASLSQEISPPSAGNDVTNNSIQSSPTPPLPPTETETNVNNQPPTINGDNLTSKSNSRRGRSRKPNQAISTATATTTQSTTTRTAMKGKTAKSSSAAPSTTRRHSRFGNLPDIEWGSISMDDLRKHPSFVPLPPPEDLPELKNLEDVKNIRQDSWQWDALHDGRCTTSQAVAALGFLEPKAGRILGVPSTWQRRGIGVYQRLRQKALRTLDEMNAILLPHNINNNNRNNGSNNRPSSSSPGTTSSASYDAPTFVQKDFASSPSSSSKLWKAANPRNSHTFSARYLGKLSNKERRERRRRAILYAENGLGIRMMWGNAQEATSVLTALNYFSQQNHEVVVKEIGMCGAGLSVNQTDGSSPSSLLIGATPDAVIEHPDGRIEALEVKNHCPFVHCRTTNKKKNGPSKQFTVRELPFKMPYIFPLYVPQLMLEMLCLGPKCRSAVMVRQTATNGALILRIQRDDDWIDEMLYWLQRFQQDYVERGVEPASNFFFDSQEDGPRYQAFLGRTREIANRVDVVARLPHKMIQRAISQEDPLFLD